MLTSCHRLGMRVPEDDDADDTDRPIQFMDIDAMDTRLTDSDRE